MNRRSFLKRAAQAAAAVSAAAVVGREAPRITGRSETYAVVDEGRTWYSGWVDFTPDGSRNAIPLVKPSLTVDLAQYMPGDGQWHNIKVESTGRSDGMTLWIDNIFVSEVSL